MRYVGRTYFFQKRKFLGFISVILRMVSLLGEKFIFFNSLARAPLGQRKFQQFPNFLCIFMLSFSLTFQNNLNYASTLNIREAIKFSNLGNKSFETDFNEMFNRLCLIYLALKMC